MMDRREALDDNKSIYMTMPGFDITGNTLMPQRHLKCMPPGIYVRIWSIVAFGGNCGVHLGGNRQNGIGVHVGGMAVL